MYKIGDILIGDSGNYHLKYTTVIYHTFYISKENIEYFLNHWQKEDLEL